METMLISTAVLDSHLSIDQQHKSTFCACCDSPKAISSQAISKVFFHVCIFTYRHSMLLLEEKENKITYIVWIYT